MQEGEGGDVELCFPTVMVLMTGPQFVAEVQQNLMQGVARLHNMHLHFYCVHLQQDLMRGVVCSVHARIQLCGVCVLSVCGMRLRLRGMQRLCADCVLWWCS